LLGPVPIRRFGLLAIDCLLGATGIKLLAVEDADAMARIKNRLEPRRKAPRPPARFTSAIFQNPRH